MALPLYLFAAGPEAIGHGQLRQRDCAYRGKGEKAQEEKCCGKLFDPWLAEFGIGVRGILGRFWC